MKDYKFLGSADYTNYGDNNDISFDTSLKDINTHSGVDRKRQDISKILLTEANGNLLYPDYGAGLNDYIFSNSFDSNMRKQLGDSVIEAMSYLNKIEESTEDNERIASVDSLKLSQPDDKRKVNINMQITLVDGTVVDVTLGGIL
jgi:phage baseplate assembly protein W